MRRFLILFFILTTMLFQASASEVLTEDNVRAFIAERNEKIDLLIKSFSNTNNLDLNKSILYALGEFRAEKAIPFLLEHIIYGIPTGNIKGFPKYGPLPAASALVKIGLPAIPYIIADIKKGREKHTQQLLAETLIDIGGTDFACLLLNKEIENSTNKNESDKLKEALFIVKQQKARELQNSK